MERRRRGLRHRVPQSRAAPAKGEQFHLEIINEQSGERRQWQLGKNSAQGSDTA